MNLREGVKFSDGSPMTAADVVNWLKHYKEKGSFTAWLAKVTDISATGPLQVTLKLNAPDPMLPYGLDQDGMAGDVVGPAGLAHPDSLGVDDERGRPLHDRPKATILNSQYVYVKNPYYWDASAQHWDKVVIKIISDSNAMLSALKTGQVQVAEGAATEAAEVESAGLQIVSAPSAMLGMYIGDIDGKIVPALKDVRVRQALNYAIDRKGIVESLYGKYGRPTAQFVPPGIGGYIAKLDDVYPYDPKKAKQLLAEAGFPRRLRLHARAAARGLERRSDGPGDGRQLEGCRGRRHAEAHRLVRDLRAAHALAEISCDDADVPIFRAADGHTAARHEPRAIQLHGVYRPEGERARRRPAEA